MNSKERIINYLEKYQNIWHVYEGDVNVSVIGDNPEDYYGWNLTGRYRMMMLFFTSQSNCFPGIWIGENDHDDDLENCPIYWCDISDITEPKYMGNFKTYMQNAIETLKEMTEADFSNHSISEEYDLNNFSDNILIYNEPFTRNILETENEQIIHHL